MNLVAPVIPQDGFRYTKTVLSDDTAVLEFETRLAKASRARVDLRDPHLNYHLMSVADFEKETPGVSWKPYFEGLDLGSLPTTN